MKRNIECIIILFHCLLLINFHEINGRMIKNFTHVGEEGFYVAFNHFYPLRVKEELISDNQRKGSCGSCQIQSNTHDLLNQRNNLANSGKCYGELRNCSVNENLHGAGENPSDCSGSCACVCYTKSDIDDKQQVDSLCLDKVSVNVSQHYVITGVQFTTVRNIIKLQVEQGKLEDGIIARGTLSWVTSSRECSRVVPIDHYQSLFTFDKISFPPGYALTGISFNKCLEVWETMNTEIETIRNCDSDFIFLNAFGTTLEDIENGIGDNIIEGERSDLLHLKNRHDYTNADMLNPSRALREDQEIKRGHYTSFKSIQRLSEDPVRIIPYFSAQKLVAKPAKPVVAIEMVYYGDTKHGGYISPIIYTA